MQFDDMDLSGSQIVIELHQDPFDENTLMPEFSQENSVASEEDTVTLDLEACPPQEVSVITDVVSSNNSSNESEKSIMKTEEKCLLDESSASSYSACTFTLIEGVSQRGKPKLFDAEGYSYSLRNPHHKDEHRAWRCTSRSQKRRCDASILQKGNKFFPLHMPHTHLPKLNAEAMATVRAISKRKSESMPTVPASKIVRDTLQEIIPEKSSSINTSVVTMIAKCVTRYRKTRLREKHDSGNETNDISAGNSPKQISDAEDMGKCDDRLSDEVPAKRMKLITTASNEGEECSQKIELNSANSNDEKNTEDSIVKDAIQLAFESANHKDEVTIAYTEKPMLDRNENDHDDDDDIFNYFEIAEECLDIKTLLENVPPEFLRKHIEGSDSQHLVLATANQINLLYAAKALYFDIASSFAPQPFIQLLTIKVFIKKNESYEHVPVAFCLMSRTGRDDYKAVLESLFYPISEEIQCKTLVAEMDISLWKALRDVLPRRRIRTCCSHYRKNIRNYLDIRDLSPAMNIRGPLQTYIHKVLSLCFLPGPSVPGIFDFLEKEARTEKMCELLKYVETYYVENAVWGRSWSVYDCPIRTSSDVNNWLRWLSSSTNPVSNFESFIEMIYKGSRALSESAELLAEARLKRLQNQDSASVHRKLYQSWDEHKDGSKSTKKLLFSCCQLSNQIDRALAC